MAAAPGRTAHQPTARELVEGIAEEHGIVSESDLTEIGAMNQRIRSVVEKALLQKDQLIGSSILTLAKNLNTSHARFVFELLQNADDNKFVVANSRGVEPFVKFSVYRERIKIECNEDGFTYHDLKAICAIGQSSKNRSHGYIGEKGIGFKSVFMAAYKVNILSNDFSFSFTHRKGDSGLGMVTPIWEPDFIPQYEQASSSITLHLHQYDDTSLSEAARQREEINREFENLPITVLLFLRNLRRIEIQFHDDNDTETKRVEYSFSTSSSSTLIERVWLSDRESSSGETVQRKHHVTRQVIQDAPPNENRELSEGNGRADAETEVILAFPLTDDYTPIIDNQPVFAFLPMMPLGFKFIIQADFVTNSSREGIVISSARNLAIRNGIATCFLKAVEEMCQHPMLQFQWMRWLPQRHSYPWDSFWSGLLEDIVSRIKTSKILRTRGSGHLGGIHSLRRLQSNWLDEAGTPLFDDLDAEIYVAEEYQIKDLSLLEPYGLKWLSADERIARMERDLGQPTESLSPELDFVRIFRPESFIEALQHHWILLNHDDSRISKFLRNLRDLNITCKDGRDYPLAETFLPLLELQAVVSSYLGDSTISFLQIDEAAYSASYHSKWGFLVNELGVRARDDVNLRLSILEKVIEGQPQQGSYRKILGLYEMIQLRCEESASKDQVATVVRISAAEDGILTWRRPDTCVWAAPGVPYAYTALEGRFTNDCSEDPVDSLERFMKVTLGIGDWDEKCCIQELKHMKGANCDDFDWVVEIYEFIHACDMSESQLKDFRTLFRTTPLIFVPNGETFRWCTTAECLWSSGAKIQGRTTLSSIYEDLEDFFVETLGVQRLTLAMACDELLKKGTEQTAATIAEVKETIWAVNTLLQTATLYPDPEQVASHFNSPRSDDVHGLYHTLRATEVFETHGISSEIHLVQDGKAHIHVKSSSELHIREAAGRLQIYVPLSKERQDFCYHSSLPRRLLEWVMTEPETQICGAISQSTQLWAPPPFGPPIYTNSTTFHYRSNKSAA
ncbi:hypothetical protein CSPX01_07703 [Colletotrichum filicis]|nr:hypothetical protein CSPX01_07703 [Colletotrichum filicis]